jgi:hypothetical protein
MDRLERRQLLSLTIDLRLSDDSKTVVVDHVGQVVQIQVYGQPRGVNANMTDEGLADICGSFLSGDELGGAARGNLKVSRVYPYNATGSTNGKQVDLDGDGDLDVGSNKPSSAKGYYAGRFDPRWDPVNKMPRGQEMRLAKLTFTVTQLLSGDATLINFRNRVARTNELHMEDGQVIVGSVVLSGEPIRVVRGAGSAPSGSGHGSGSPPRLFSTHRLKPANFDELIRPLTSG